MNGIKITPELCEFVGALIGDGNLWHKGLKYRVEFTGDPVLDLEYYSHLTKIVRSSFGVSPQKLKVRYGGLRLRITSKALFLFLTDLGLPYGKGKAEIVKIPNKIIKIGWRYTKSVIRGIFDADGTLFFSKKTYEKAIYPTIEISTGSRGLGKQLESELNRHGFNAHLRSSKPRKINYLTEYHIALYGNRMMELWFKKIGSSNPRHYGRFIYRKNLYKEDSSNHLQRAAIA